MIDQMIDPMDTPLVAVEALELRAGPRPALSGVDLRVGAGKVHGLLGPKGAGKSSLLQVLAGQQKLTAGSVQVAQACVLVAGDDGGSPIESQLTVGTRMRFALARGVAAEPAVLLVDEPAGGFDAETAAAARALVQRHTLRGGACVWASRRLDSLHGLATGVTVLAAGRPRYSGSVETLMIRALAGSAEHWEQPLEHAA
jgi:ABC-type multidrug transport system ATPase subunit